MALRSWGGESLPYQIHAKTKTCALLKALLQNLRLPFLQIKYHLSKQPICPREPLPRPVRHIKRVYALMNEPYKSSQRPPEKTNTDVNNPHPRTHQARQYCSQSP